MIAILGGTFDPVHVGHLRMAWEVAEQLECEVHLVPCHIPPHRAATAASAADRLTMLQLALSEQSRLIANDCELRRGGPSYSIDTVRQFREQVGADCPLVLVLGVDAFRHFSSWYQWRDIFSLAHIVVVTRPGAENLFEADLAAEWFARKVDHSKLLHNTPSGSVLPMAVTAIDVSATQIRRLLAAGKTPQYLLTAPVQAFIERHHLYRV